MNTHTQHTAQHTAQPTAPDSWRDVWTDRETVRVQSRIDQIREDEADLADFYAAARLAVS